MYDAEAQDAWWVWNSNHTGPGAPAPSAHLGRCAAPRGAGAQRAVRPEPDARPAIVKPDDPPFWGKQNHMPPNAKALAAPLAGA
jgi:hypothetical protein